MNYTIWAIIIIILFIFLWRGRTTENFWGWHSSHRRWGRKGPFGVGHGWNYRPVFWRGWY